MSYQSLLRQRADIYRPTDSVPTGPEANAAWPSTPTYSSVPCRIQQMQTSERDKETGAVGATHQSFWLFDVDLTEKDRVIVGGVTYDVQGVNHDVTGAGHHVEAMLKSVT